MRRRAAELGVCYSPLPPYEVLQTREITPHELQAARQLSRLIDGFYNAKAWQQITRRLILGEEDFLKHLLEHLIATGVADQPLGLERRGVILYEFCRSHYPAYLTGVALAWIEAGMSLKKAPLPKRCAPNTLRLPAMGYPVRDIQKEMRLCCLSDPASGCCYWYGFETESQHPLPVFKAVSPADGGEFSGRASH